MLRNVLFSQSEITDTFVSREVKLMLTYKPTGSLRAEAFRHRNQKSVSVSADRLDLTCESHLVLILSALILGAQTGCTCFKSFVR